MLLYVFVSFLVGLLAGKALHLAAEERCAHVEEINVDDYGSQKRPLRCVLREEHRGPHKMRHWRSADIILPTTTWRSEEEARDR